MPSSIRECPRRSQGKIGSLNREKTIPEYGTNYTLEKLEDGFYRSLQYDEEQGIKTFPAALELPPGDYLLGDGKATSDGDGPRRLEILRLGIRGREKEIELTLRAAERQGPQFGKLKDPSSFFKALGVPRGAKGTFAVWIVPEQEPSRHLVSDLVTRKSELEEWGGKLILFIQDPKAKESFIAKTGKEMARNVVYGEYSTAPFAQISQVTGESIEGKMPIALYLTPKTRSPSFPRDIRLGRLATGR